MHLTGGTLVLSPTDLVGYLDCEHLTQLDVAVALGSLPAPVLEDPELDVVRRRGAEHEAALLAERRMAGLSVVEIPSESATPEAYSAAQEQTLAAMRSGADVIYQGVLFDGRWLGYVDFLERTAAGAYEVVDTKLARRAKTAALVQTALYSWLLEKATGDAPERMHLVLGDGSRHSFRVEDYAPYVALARERLEAAVASRPLTYPEPVQHCGVCRWRERCRAQWEADDHLSLVAGIRRDQANRLRSAGVATVAELASAPPLQVERMSLAALERLHSQARLQVAGRESDRPIHELLPLPAAELGLAELPAPTAGDLFFDMEGDPYVDGGLEYLFGLTELSASGAAYRAFWAHDRAGEKTAFEAAVDFMIERLDANPAMHVYHYAAYEPSALKRLMGLHATRESEVDRLLRGGVLVDLYAVVKRSLRISLDSYSLKSVELFYMPERGGLIHDAGSSIVAYEKWLDQRSQPLLDEIERYNEEDCLSTLRLRDWLESLREPGLPRPPPRSGLAQPEQEERERETAALSEALLSGVPDSAVARTAEEQARWLLAQSLWFHRREQKSQWWAHFRRLEMSDEELIDDADALGGLTYMGEQGRVARSAIHSYRHPPQEHKIHLGSAPLDPRTGHGAGTVVDVDPVAGTILLKRGLGSPAPHPSALIPGEPLNDMALRLALRRVAEWVLASGIDAPGRYRAVRDLLLRRPRLPPVSPVSASEAAVAMVVALDQTCLGIQGPPGSGKTTTGARMVVELVRQGRSVGLTALSHKVIGHFLEEVVAEAGRQRVAVRMLQKADEDERCAAPEVECCAHNSEVVAALHSRSFDVVAGTAWLFADPEMDGLLDTLLIDEAGQVPLANAIAVAGATANLVLLGDPNQLAQPIQGSHPPGADVSALQHLLGEEQTMPAGRGLFLDMSWRMHPQICAFISEIAYAGRLGPAPGCELQQAVGQAGLRFVPVDHTGNRTSSFEEAEAVASLARSLIGGSWVDRSGASRPLTLADILLVAPYNSQVGVLGRLIPGARVGTVDKFQGQQAAVTIYSMATSSPDEVPHGVDFLYSLNRLNVAVSRAHALSFVVCSPKLLLLRPRHPEQMRLAAALCRLANMYARC